MGDYVISGFNFGSRGLSDQGQGSQPPTVMINDKTEIHSVYCTFSSNLFIFSVLWTLKLSEVQYFYVNK